MDEMVRKALAKWPNVPHCYGWLALDARGDWYMRDDRAQALGHKGSRIQHEKLLEFIQRNYDRDADGCWFFQNGPQRVYVELEAAPFVWRLQPAEPPCAVVSHTGIPTLPTSAWLDEHGRLFLATERGLGLVHTQDMHLAATAVEQGHWTPQPCRFEELPARFGYVLSPAQRRLT